MLFEEFTTCEAMSETPENPEVQGLIDQRNKLLSDHPHLRAAQDEIDRLLSTTLDPQVRLEILFMLISEKLGEMKTVFGEVTQLVETTFSHKKGSGFCR